MLVSFRSLVLGCIGAAFVVSLSAVAANAQVPLDPLPLVNPFIGTSGTDKDDMVDDFPGADMPMGMLQWSPDTPSKLPSSGYDYADTATTGFSLTHISGAGCAVFGDFRFLPTIGVIVDPAHAQQPFSHADESASPGYYAVNFDQAGIQTQLAVTARTGLGEFTFPASKEANLLINTSSDQAGVSDAHFHVVNAHEISGSATSGSFCGMPNVFTVYFDAQFDHDFTTSGTWKDATVSPGATDADGPQTGGYVRFDTTTGDRTVAVKVAVSWVSVDGARRNIAAEGTTWSIDAVRNAATRAWRDVLKRITIAGGSATEQRIFYTALYHVFLHPNIFSDADGSYRGFDNAVHQTAPGHVEYANFSGWDTYRTQNPLIALLAPHEASDMIRTLLDNAHQGGWLPKWPLANAYTAVMAGDSADPLIAGAYAFGARDFDRSAALAAMVKGATNMGAPLGQDWYVERPGLDEYLKRGYVVNVHTTSVSPVPNGASETLEYALDDFSIARLAFAAHDLPTYRAFMHRSQNWSTLFNGEEGLISPRDGDGAFIHTPISNLGQSGFQEGNAWQYTWMVPQNLGGLVTALGGRTKTIARLDRFFTYINAGQTQPYAWFGNEPSLISAWTYLYAGAPSSEQRVNRRVMTSLYTTSPDGVPGNDDLGTMSAWYIWNALGLYPVNPSVPLLLVGSPLFHDITVHSPGGISINIKAPQAGDANPYVQALSVGGKPTTRSWVDLPAHGALNLNYTLSATPNYRWGVAADDVPPSYPAGPLTLPAATAAAFTPIPPLSLAPGAEALPVSIGLTNAAGATPAAVTWTAAVPAHFTLSPANGTLAADARGAVTATAKLSADAAVSPGLYNIDITGRAANGALLAHAVVVARVAGGHAAVPAGYIANFADNTVTAVDPHTHAYGTPIAVGMAPGGLALSPDGTRLYAANQGSNTVSVIDTASNSVVATVNVGNVPAGIHVAPDGKTVWLANYGDNTAQAIDTATLKPSTPIRVGLAPEGLTISPNSATVYVVGNGSNDVTPIDARRRVAAPPITVGRRPLGIAISPDGQTLFVGNMESNTVTVVSTARATAIATIPVGKTPQGLSVSPDGSLAYVTNSGSSTVTAIDTRTLKATASIFVGNGPFDVAFTADGKTAFVVNTGDNDWVPIDVIGNTLGMPLPAGNFPIAITLSR